MGCLRCWRVQCQMLIQSTHRRSRFSKFTWNGLWNWADRVRDNTAHARTLVVPTNAHTLLDQFGRSRWLPGFGIALQYGLTQWMAHALHYLLANVIAIVIASVSNFLANDH